MDEYSEEFRMNLKFYREQKGWSQAELAIQANSSNGQIGNIEAGKAFPSFELILRIADAFSIHPADLFLRDSSKVQDRELYSKYHELLLNCEHLPECHKQIVNQLVKSLAESTIEYKTSHKKTSKIKGSFKNGK